ncbi:MAG: hypothetical protein VX527_11385 [Planctomycetota bacterium]|nr:hypothetical protein [Planctomycetota bacterium]
MNTRRVQFSILAANVLLLGTGLAPALAQQEPLHGLQPVDQQVADHGPLSTSLRWVQYGLREPYSFSELYQLPVGEKNYVRRNAGLWAVFPRSLYVAGEEGIVASVPAGTMYYIGGPTEVMASITNQQSAYVQVGQIEANRVDEHRIEAELIDRRVPASSIQPNMEVEPTPVRRSRSLPKPTTIDADISARAAWVAAMPTFDFVQDEHYRRDCLKKAMVSVQGSGARSETRIPEATEPTEEVTTP